MLLRAAPLGRELIWGACQVRRELSRLLLPSPRTNHFNGDLDENAMRANTAANYAEISTDTEEDELENDDEMEYDDREEFQDQRFSDVSHSLSTPNLSPSEIHDSRNSLQTSHC